MHGIVYTPQAIVDLMCAWSRCGSLRVCRNRTRNEQDSRHAGAKDLQQARQNRKLVPDLRELIVINGLTVERPRAHTHSSINCQLRRTGHSKDPSNADSGVCVGPQPG